MHLPGLSHHLRRYDWNVSGWAKSLLDVHLPGAQKKVSLKGFMDPPSLKDIKPCWIDAFLWGSDKFT